MIETGTASINADGTANISGLAGYIYKSRMAGYEQDYGSNLPSYVRQLPVKQAMSAAAARDAEAISSYLLDNVVTIEGGYTVRLLNKTGLQSVKGSVVEASPASNNAFQLQSTRLEAIGIVYEDGIDDGFLCRVVVAGIAEVLLEDGVNVKRGDWLGCSSIKGRAYHDLTFPPPEHFREIGHSIQSVNAGTNVLVKAVIHFN